MESGLGAFLGEILSLLDLGVRLGGVQDINTVLHELVSELGVLGQNLDGFLHRPIG